MPLLQTKYLRVVVHSSAVCRICSVLTYCMKPMCDYHSSNAGHTFNNFSRDFTVTDKFFL